MSSGTSRRMTELYRLEIPEAAGTAAGLGNVRSNDQRSNHRWEGTSHGNTGSGRLRFGCCRRSCNREAILRKWNAVNRRNDRCGSKPCSSERRDWSHITIERKCAVFATTVSLQASMDPFQATTGKLGRYRFDPVDLRAATVDVIEAVTTDRGRATATLAANGEARTANRYDERPRIGYGHSSGHVRTRRRLPTHRPVQIQTNGTTGCSSRTVANANGVATFARILSACLRCGLMIR